jgi:hypothetical protein
MRVAEKLDWKGLKVKKIVGNRKIIMSDEIQHMIGNGKILELWTFENGAQVFYRNASKKL